MEIGQIVYSLAGRDKTMPFVVTKAEGDYVYLIDGKHRKIISPKKKKIKHIQKTKSILKELQDKIISDTLLDADVRKALSLYKTIAKRED